MESQLLAALKKHRMIVALRGVAPDRIVDTARALYDGGVRMLEITFNQSSPTRLMDTAQAISAVKDALGDRLMVGAGTVMHLDDLHAAHQAGAGYMLSPNLNSQILARAKELGMGTVPGAMTPTEVAAAYDAGADLVKLFPCDVLGLGYIKALKAPVSHVPLLAMGGVNVSNLMEYLALVEGVGVGSAIAKTDLINEGRFLELAELARQFTEQFTV